MKSLLASVRAVGGLDRVGHVVQALEEEWRQHGDVDLERLWTERKRDVAVEGDDSVVVLAELIKADLQCRFARGQRPAVAGYLERFPALRGAESRVLSLIYEEYCLVEEQGEKVDVESFCNRYSAWKESLVSQLRYHHLFSQAAGLAPSPPPFPKPGDTFEEFELLSLLGKGGTSRVFLARDISLGGKQVVLKVSLDRGREPQVQGALDHPHIVPVNSVVFNDHQMRGLSMPFRPGLPLDEIIKRVDPARRPRPAIAIWDALVRGIAERRSDPANGDSPPLFPGPAPGACPKGDGWEGFPARGTYSQGAAWVAMIVAQALDYAHGQSTYHRDVKPGNVLLTLGYGPQLLDFNLAESPHSASQAEAAMHGGTLPYMAPEQIEAFFRAELWEQVGARADIYSLGLVLRELLTGQAPDLPAETLSPPRAMRLLLDRRPLMDVSVRPFHPAVPHALEAIVARCLAYAPADRYPTAQALANDLDSFLQHRPLIHATNPSRRERFGNRLVRSRRSLAVLAACLVALGVWLARPAFLRPPPATHPIAKATIPGAPVNRPPPPIETLPRFLDQVHGIEEGRFDPAHARGRELVGRLRGLVKDYPRSPLPRLYLAFALDSEEEPSGEAEALFRRALESPDARSTLIAWGQDHPGLISHLDKFSKARVKHAKNIVTNLVEDKNPDASDEDKNRIRKPYYELAAQALKLALDLGARSPESLARLALFEESVGDDNSAYGQITCVIDDVRKSHCERAMEALKLVLQLGVRSSRPLALLAVDENWLGESASAYRRLANLIHSAKPSSQAVQDLNGWCGQRCRIATRLADALRSKGSPQEALKYMRQAEKDLEFCGQVLKSRHATKRQTSFVVSNELPAMLTLGELKIDLGDLAEARKHLDLVDGLFPKVEEIDPRDRPPRFKMVRWQQRLAVARNRLESGSPGDRRGRTLAPDRPGRIAGTSP